MDQDSDGEVDEGASVHVETWGREGGAGSEDDPLVSISEALASGSACIEVGPGIYYENLTITEGPVWLYSTVGSDGTILDGMQEGTVLTVSSRVTGDVVLEGFTVQNGSATYGGGLYISTVAVTARDLHFSSNYATSNGGGIYLLRGSLDASGCSFESNTANQGGGLYTDAGVVTLTDTTVQYNAAYYGGGLLSADGEITIGESTFSENTAVSGGAGLHLTGGSVTMENVEITGGSVNRGPGAGALLSGTSASLTGLTVRSNMSNGGGGAGLSLVETSANLVDSSIMDNAANSGSGGGLLLAQDSTAEVENLVLSGNRSDGGYGGGLFLYDGSWMRGTAVEVTGNAAVGGYGGGIAADSSSGLDITGIDLSENGAVSFGGGLFDGSQVSLSQARIAFNSADYVGGLAVRDSGSLTLTNAVLLGNYASTGTSGTNHYGATLSAYNQGGLTLRYCTVVGSMGDYAIAVQSSTYFSIMSSIVAYNSGIGLDLPVSTYVYLTGAFNDFYGNEFSNVYYNDSSRSRVEGGGTLWMDPEFIWWDGSALDSVDLHLISHSPCVDAGNDAEYDVDGSRADMGAYGGPGGSWE
jgi:predicted outer membrane repeat protein